MGGLRGAVAPPPTSSTHAQKMILQMMLLARLNVHICVVSYSVPEKYSLLTGGFKFRRNGAFCFPSLIKQFANVLEAIRGVVQKVWGCDQKVCTRAYV